MLAIKMMVHLGTRDAHFNLTFRIDAVIPVEIKINNLRTSHFNPHENESSIRVNLDILE